MKLYVNEDGSILTFGDLPDGIELPGRKTVRRVSHVLPVNPVKRVAFRILRLAFGERGKVAAWTRSWYGPWRCVLVDDRSRQFIHQSRKVVIDWERTQLEDMQ